MIFAQLPPLLLTAGFFKLCKNENETDNFFYEFCYECLLGYKVQYLLLLWKHRKF